MMKAIATRLRRLEERLGPALESWKTQRLRRLLETARVRNGSLPLSEKRKAEIKGMTIPAILNSHRRQWTDATGL